MEDEAQEHYETLIDYKQSRNSQDGATKGKYYKQTYRTAWEQMPDFKGWLRGVAGQPTRAYCLYCQKSLHAHRLSLLKHTCTIRHQKAAQLNSHRQQQQVSNTDTMSSKPVKLILTSSGSSGTTVAANLPTSSSNMQDDDEDICSIQYVDSSDIQAEEAAEEEDIDETVEGEEAEGEEAEMEEGELDGMRVHVMDKQSRQQGRVSIMSSKPVISTHVLDIARGQPVSGLQVSLYKLIEGRWTYINEGLTNPDGRCGNFLARADFTAGRYKLHFDVDRYFELRKQDTLYPFIEIVFDCRSPGAHYHIPLLLGPYGYTTYRGS